MGPVRVSLALTLALCVAPSLRADVVTDWFSSDRSEGYRGIETDVSLLRDELAAAGVMPQLLLERIKEGQAKKISPERLLSALEADTARFLSLARLFDGLPRGTARPEEKTRFIRDGAIASRSGIDDGAMESICAAVTPGGLSRMTDALLAVGAVNARFRLDSGTLTDLAVSLYASPEREGRFSRLSSVFVRSRSLGNGADETARRAIALLRAGGTLFSVEAAIEEGHR